MWWLALSRVRLDWRRSLATVLAVLFAVTSFVVLTGVTTTQRVEALQTADSNYRSSYDVLVRPVGAQTVLEQETGRVRPNFLSDTYGGITVDQWRQIQQIPGVEVAAPIATVGLIWAQVAVPIDLSEQVAKSGTQLFRVTTTSISRGGFTAPNQAAYLYVTDNQLTPGERGQVAEEVDGVTVHPCLAAQRADKGSVKDQAIDSPYDPAARFHGSCVSRKDPEGVLAGRLVVSVPVMIAGIDPESEAALVGLDDTVVSGRYLSGDDSLMFRPAAEQGAPNPREDSPVAPSLLAATAPDADYRLQVSIDELSGSTVEKLRKQDYRTDQMNLVADAVPARRVSTSVLPLSDIHARLVDATRPQPEQGPDTSDELWTLSVLRPSPVDFTPGSGLIATASEPELSPYYNHGWNTLWDPVPGSVGDSAYRTVRVLDSEKVRHFGVLSFEVVGVFDPSTTATGPELSQVPLETYRTPTVTAADEATGKLLGRKEFMPNLNPADYLMTQPTVLIPLDALGIVAKKYLSRTDLADPATDLTAPISAVRVRVAGVTGWDQVSQERVRLAAQRIHDHTGLTVDITIGSALANQPVTLTQTGGRPDLRLTELWSVKGVITTIVDAIDRKSVLLFALILVSCALTIATVASASAQAQRTDLGVLAAVGFRPGRLAGLLLTQQGLLGLAAGVAGAVLAWPVALVTGVGFSLQRALLAVPVALGLMLLASLPAAFGPARTMPVALLGPPVRTGRHSLPVHSTLMMGVTSITRRPWRLARAALSIALAVVAVAWLLTIAWTFEGAVVGNLVGDAIALQVRAADLAAGGILAVLGLVCVAMTLSFGTIEDASDWAVLRAIGWRPGLIVRAILAQGAAIGLLGALLGAFGALALAGVVLGAAPAAVAVPVVGVATAAALGSTLAAVIPAVLLQRTPLAGVLAEDS